MTTKLNASPVIRELEYEIDGRKVIVGLKSEGNEDYLTIRLGGFRSGWRASLREIAQFAVLHPREKNQDFVLQINSDLEKVKEWAKEYEASKK